MSTILRVNDLEKHYKLGKNNYVHALKGVSAEIKAGNLTAIMGPSGSGKSTLMHVIGCLSRPDSGEVWLNGRRVDNLSDRKLTGVRSREIGFIFQGFNLVSTLSAIENVALAAEYAGKSGREAYELARRSLKEVGLADRANHFPNEMSGGQQQRVAIARALVNKPSLVLGDEPTGDLDTATSDEIVNMMRDKSNELGITFVLVTHNPEVAEACDSVIYVRDGMIEKVHESKAIKTEIKVLTNV